MASCNLPVSNWLIAGWLTKPLWHRSVSWEAALSNKQKTAGKSKAGAQDLNTVFESFTDREKLAIAGFSAVFLFVVWLLSPVLMPFLVAAGLAYLGDPIVDRMENMKLSRGIAVSIVYAVLSVVSLLVLIVILPLLERQIGYIISKLPEWVKWVETVAIPKVQERFGLAGTGFDMASLAGVIRENWSEAGGVAAALLQSVSKSGLQAVGLVANLLIIPIAAFYLLRDWDIMVGRVHELIPRRVEPNVVRLAQESDEMLSGFLRGQFIVMSALSFIYVVGLWIAGVKLALLIGLFAGLMSFVPYLGVVAGLLSASVAILVQTQDPTSLIWVFAVFGVGQLLESMILTPVFVGDRIGLHPVLVIFAVMAGGQLFGFVGVLLALPASAIIAVIARHVHEGYQHSPMYAQEQPGSMIETPIVTNSGSRKRAKSAKKAS